MTSRTALCLAIITAFATAAPAEPPPADEATLRGLIATALPDASPDEVAGWLETLRGMSAESAKGLLEVRRRVGTSVGPVLVPPPGGADGEPGEPATVEVEEVTPANRFADAFRPADFAPPRTRQECSAAYRTMLELLEADRACRSLPGYVAVEPRVDGWPVRFSRGPGAVVETGRGLDAAVWADESERPGELMFFGFVRSDGDDPDEFAFSRCGAFEIDENRELGLRVGDDFWVVVPTIHIPDGFETDEVEIARDGSVSVGPRRLGELEVYTPPHPDRLTRRGVLMIGTHEDIAWTGKANDASVRFRPRHLMTSNFEEGDAVETISEIERRLGAIGASAP